MKQGVATQLTHKPEVSSNLSTRYKTGSSSYLHFKSSSVILIETMYGQVYQYSSRFKEMLLTNGIVTNNDFYSNLDVSFEIIFMWAANIYYTT